MIIKLSFLIVFVSFIFYALLTEFFLYPHKNLNPQRLSFHERVSLLGYTSENYNVTTEDGYIIDVTRLFSKNKTLNVQNNHPVLFYSGLNCVIDVFISNFEDKSPAYYILNRGFDVWLMNNRGTFYTEGHIKYSNKDKRFWQFSF